jgi:hypothetical protein
MPFNSPLIPILDLFAERVLSVRAKEGEQVSDPEQDLDVHQEY